MPIVRPVWSPGSQSGRVNTWLAQWHDQVGTAYEEHMSLLRGRATLRPPFGDRFPLLAVSFRSGRRENTSRYLLRNSLVRSVQLIALTLTVIPWSEGIREAASVGMIGFCTVSISPTISFRNLRMRFHWYLIVNCTLFLNAPCCP